MNKTILKLFKNEKNNIPIWFLRHSGRHIPEYFKIRSKEKNFIDFCLNKDLIIESTKLPLKYYDLDAAIIFSDILMIPWAMKRDLDFVKEQGPVLTPMIPNETKIEKKISKLVAKDMKKENIFFAGIDFIDQKLNGDINVTSPTGLKTLFDLTKINLAKTFWEKLKT